MRPTDEVLRLDAIFVCLLRTLEKQGVLNKQQFKEGFKAECVEYCMGMKSDTQATVMQLSAYVDEFVF